MFSQLPHSAPDTPLGLGGLFIFLPTINVAPQNNYLI